MGIGLQPARIRGLAMFVDSEFWRRLEGALEKERVEQLTQVGNGVPSEVYPKAVGYLAGLGFALAAAHGIIREMNGESKPEDEPPETEAEEGFKDPFQEEAGQEE